MTTTELIGRGGVRLTSRAELAALVQQLRVRHSGAIDGGLCVAFSLSRAGRVDRCAVMASGEGEAVYALVCAALGAPEFAATGFFEAESVGAVRVALQTALGGLALAAPEQRVLAWLEATAEVETGVAVQLLRTAAADGDRQEDYLRNRTTLLFDLFNVGALRGSDPAARQALLDSFSTLPSRYLDASGRFIVPPREAPLFVRRVPSFVAAEQTVADAAPAGIDKFPSLIAVRGEELLADGNRIVPSAMIRDGVHVGKRNIFMFHAAVNIAAYIGDDNLIDSHASLASSAQIGNRNKIGSFVSIEGVLSPANAEPVTIGDDNFLGTFVRVGTGIRIGSRNFVGAGVALSLGTKLKDCRPNRPTTGDYVAVRDLNGCFDSIAIVPNNAVRTVDGVGLVPGEYVLFENTPDFMARFEGDNRIRTSR